MNVFSPLQSFHDQIHLVRWGADLLFRFVLENVQHIGRCAKPDGVGRSISPGTIILDQLQNASVAKPLEWLGDGRHLTLLRCKENDAEHSLHEFGTVRISRRLDHTCFALLLGCKGWARVRLF